MISSKEIFILIAVSMVLAFCVSLIETTEIFLYTLLTIFLIIFINITAKKVAGFYLDSEIELKLWEIKRYGFKSHKHFKNPFPAGLAFPLIFTAFSFGYLTWTASLIFDTKPKIYRAAKRYGLYKFSEMSEYHIGLIASAGIMANLIFSVIGYLIGFEEFSKLSIYYAFWNILPVSNLDGTQIFFGSKIIWTALAFVVLVFTLYALLLPA